jgi:voltage-gated potassium channel
MSGSLYRVVLILVLLTAVIGQTLAESQIRTRYSIIVLAIQKLAAEHMQFNPSGETRMDEGDTLIAMGDIPDL